MTTTTSTPRIVGHRGAATRAPENTLASFARAVLDGADAVELDVHATRDGRLAVHHDATLGRTSVAGRHAGRIGELTWREVAEVELAGDQRVPELAEALDLIPTDVFVEVKDVAAAAPAARLVRERGLADRVVITSFLPDALRLAASAAPEVRRGLIEVHPTRESPSLLTELGASVYHLCLAGARAEDVAQAQARGLEVGVWTLHTFDEVRRAVDLGCDTLTADDPAWCRAAVESLRAPAAGARPTAIASLPAA
ncbi:glycerophosphoryl diester phosphodiesterase [Beutenbergia cavernae DSM 12333]|uniref:Glycerophosphoryl diester phosphodiesterase n=1 Tax=Beutenbergia cavernae (strain ATCC BAA-8 / DSM 12333 / CCUG 43141 / JCM 11478 / NBRC 16432 / NCIMB 13614 / HKI 0122) TaxID=471853 RepID=C5BY91_BEUC1|nr:glycerophosphodiester phosphodiesterase [Beutenbergia cavernae]ACQ80991.1 glycerophosphoryl diester phosphodiesterase [Beutenbergia cavernae DSM 12333]